jgi:hypothetical protein
VNFFIAVPDLEAIPLDWQRGIIVPIHKSGSMHDVDDYRGIALTSNVYKVYSEVLEENIMGFLEDNEIFWRKSGGTVLLANAKMNLISAKKVKQTLSPYSVKRFRQI